MTAVVSLLTDPPEQDFIILGGLQSPGLCTLRGAGSPRDWDIRKGYGFSGASVIFTGNNLTKFEASFYLFKSEHWIQWAFFSPILKKPAGGIASVTTGIGIQHPLLTRPPLEITSVVVEDVSQFEQDEEGGWTCTVKFIEFRRPLPALSRPLASIPSVAKPEPTAQDAADVEIATKRAQLAALAAGK